MEPDIEFIHTAGNDPKWNMPYTPAIKVHSGKTVFLSGVTAAPIYHSHPHVPDEFHGIPAGAAEQAEMTMQNLKAILEAAGGAFENLVQITRYIVDEENNQDDINRVMADYLGSHRAATTSVEIVKLATDPRLVLELDAIAVVAE